jgi:hypothetical protein
MINGPPINMNPNIVQPNKKLSAISNNGMSILSNNVMFTMYVAL